MLTTEASRVISDYVVGRVQTLSREGIDISRGSFAIDGEESQTFSII
jgi:hypothetical protein